MSLLTPSSLGLAPVCPVDVTVVQLGYQMISLVGSSACCFCSVVELFVGTCDVMACCASDTAAAAPGVMQCSQVVPAAPAECLQKPEMLTCQERHCELRNKQITGQTVEKAQALCCLRAGQGQVLFGTVLQCPRSFLMFYTIIWCCLKPERCSGLAMYCSAGCNH